MKKRLVLILLLFTVYFSLFTSSAFSQATVMVNTNTGVVIFPTNLWSANDIKTGASASNDLAVVAAAGISNAVAIATLTGQVAAASAGISSNAAVIATNAAAIATLTGQVAAISLSVITNAVALQGPSNAVTVVSNRLSVTFSTNVAAAGSGGSLLLTNGTTATTAGSIYQLATNNTWTLAANTNASMCNRLLALATGTNSTAGMLRFGSISVTPSTSLSPGAVLFVAATAGGYTQTVPTNSTSIIRAIGHATATNAIFFAPDSIWGTIQ